jgi:predicted metal-binding protein
MALSAFIYNDLIILFLKTTRCFLFKYREMLLVKKKNEKMKMKTTCTKCAKKKKKNLLNIFSLESILLCYYILFAL